MNQETLADKIGRETDVICGGIWEGALDEAWKRAQDPVALGVTVVKDVAISAGVAAVCTMAPEVVLPGLAIAASSAVLEDHAGHNETLARNARLSQACQAAWNDPAKATQSKDVFAHETGKEAFDLTLGALTMYPGFSLGSRFAENKMAEFAQRSLANKSMYMSDLGQGTYQTRIGESLVTTRADGTVVKQFDSGLIQRHIPTGNGDYIFTESRPGGVLTMDLPGGTRMIELPGGRLYTFESNGTYTVEKQSGLRMSANDTNSVRTFTHPNGTITNFIGNHKERILPSP